MSENDELRKWKPEKKIVLSFVKTVTIANILVTNDTLIVLGHIFLPEKLLIEGRFALDVPTFQNVSNGTQVRDFGVPGS